MEGCGGADRVWRGSRLVEDGREGKVHGGCRRHAGPGKRHQKLQRAVGIMVVEEGGRG